MTDEQFKISRAKEALTQLYKGDPISDEDLGLCIRSLKSVVGFFDGINFRKYDLVTNDLRHDLDALEGYATVRKEDRRRQAHQSP